MKLIFAGTPPFAAAALSAVHAAGHDIVLVLTQPDRPAGRGLKLTSSAVAQVAGRLAQALEKPGTLKDAVLQARLRECGADLMVVAAYGLLLPQAVLDIPAKGCLNIHASLLPRWRGAAPVQRAIEAGDTQTGISIMQMDAGLDTGAVLLKRRLAIASDETSTSLLEKLTSLGASTIVDALAMLPTMSPSSQSLEGATYAKKIEKSESRIDWNQPAELLERRIRAFDPFPGCETRVGAERIKVWRARVVNNQGLGVSPGIVTNANQQSLTVQCGEQQLELLTIQRPGGKRIAASEFFRGAMIAAGTRLS